MRARIRAPWHGRRGGCWVEIRQHTGSLLPQYAACAKSARKGRLTCHWHQKHEAAAHQAKGRA